jgi:putative ubiquitin-RnfH superfamily antitoxin RatB of RatAB toxin-antitoxin module
MDSLLSVEVAYADACRQIVVPVEVPGGTTLAQAVALSAIAEQLVGVDVVAAPKGVYGKKRPDHWLLEEGDRVEIYRPLVHNPRDARRRRASRQR